MSASSSSSSQDTCGAFLDNLDRHLVYFPNPASGSMQGLDASSTPTPSVGNQIGRFRLTPAGLCVNWYSEASLWLQCINREVDRVLTNSETGVATSASTFEAYISPLLMSTWSWNVNAFNRSESSDLILRAMFSSDDDINGSKVASYLHNFMGARVADKLLWALGDNRFPCNRRTFFKPSTVAHHPTISAFEESLSAWQADVFSFVDAYKKYRMHQPNTVDFMLTGTEASMSVGERIWRACGNVSGSRLVSTVLEKILQASAGLCGLVNVSLSYRSIVFNCEYICCNSYRFVKILSSLTELDVRA